MKADEDNKEEDPDYDSVSSQEKRVQKMKHLKDFMKASGKSGNISQLTVKIDNASSSTKYRTNKSIAGGIEALLEAFSIDRDDVPNLWTEFLESGRLNKRLYGQQYQDPGLKDIIRSWQHITDYNTHIQLASYLIPRYSRSQLMKFLTPLELHSHAIPGIRKQGKNFRNFF